MNVLGVSVSIGNLDIHVHGGASCVLFPPLPQQISLTEFPNLRWLYQFFVDVLKGKIKDDAQNALAKAISNGIDNQANDALVRDTMKMEKNVSIKKKTSLTKNLY